MTRLTRNPTTVYRELDNSVFLVGTCNDAVFHLNPIGAAIWKLLETPITEEEITKILVEAFPDAPAKQVRDDVTKHFRDLESRGFLASAD